MRVLILSAHTDDAELGAGGTAIKLKSQGHQLRWITFSSCKESLPCSFKSYTLEREFFKAMEVLGLNETSFMLYDTPVRRFHVYRQDILDKLILEKKGFKPDLVFAPSLRDTHQDHSVLASEALRAFRNYCSLVNYELPWNQISSERNMFIEMPQQHVEKKKELVACYKSQREIGKLYCSDEFIESSAVVAGVQIGVKYAEAFEVVRWRLLC